LFGRTKNGTARGGGTFHPTVALKIKMVPGERKTKISHKGGSKKLTEDGEDAEKPHENPVGKKEYFGFPTTLGKLKDGRLKTFTTQKAFKPRGPARRVEKSFPAQRRLKDFSNSLKKKKRTRMRKRRKRGEIPPRPKSSTEKGHAA